MSVASVGFAAASPAPEHLSGNIRGQAVRQHDQPEAKNKPETKVKPQVIHSAAADLQRISHAFNKKLQFVVDHRSNEVIVKVIDKDTDKVIKELPPEELQRLHRNIKEAIGLLFDEMV
jgi:flagellar protein FlaG